VIVFTPKSLLRIKAATSATVEFTHGYFQAADRRARRIRAGKVAGGACTGKIYLRLRPTRQGWCHGHRDVRGRAALPGP